MSPFCEVPRADQPDGRDVFFLILGARGLGKLGQRPDGDERQPQLVASLEQQGVEQGAIFAGAIEVLDQAVDARPRAAERQRFLE